MGFSKRSKKEHQSPVVSTINSVTYSTKKHLAAVFTPPVGNTHPIKDSMEFNNYGKFNMSNWLQEKLQ